MSDASSSGTSSPSGLARASSSAPQPPAAERADEELVTLVNGDLGNNRTFQTSFGAYKTVWKFKGWTEATEEDLKAQDADLAQQA